MSFQIIAIIVKRGYAGVSQEWGKSEVNFIPKGPTPFSTLPFCRIAWDIQLTCKTAHRLPHQQHMNQKLKWKSKEVYCIQLCISTRHKANSKFIQHSVYIIKYNAGGIYFHQLRIIKHVVWIIRSYCITKFISLMHDWHIPSLTQESLNSYHLPLI